MKRRDWLVVPLALAVLGCGSEDAHTNRCDLCGMVVDPESGWRAGGNSGDGSVLRFDTPKCLFRHHHERGAVGEPWVVEYDAQTRRSASELFYVLGSDAEGPMGRDLVPLATRERAEGFQMDHHGTDVLTFDEVTAEITAELHRPQS